MNLKTLLCELSSADAIGSVAQAADLAAEILGRYVPVTRQNGLTFFGTFAGDCGYTIMLDAHIDQIGMIVTAVDEEGFLTLAKAGGIDLRALPARQITIHGKQPVPAVFCSTPPHLAGEEKSFEDLSAIKADTALGAKAKELVAVGDIATFSGNPIMLARDRICGRSLDDRAGVACLLALAERLSHYDRLPVRVCLAFTDGEELGMRGIRPAAYVVDPQEAIAVDVTFGDGLGLSEEETGKVGGGPMIGISPSLDQTLSNGLIALAEKEKIPYQIEVMGRTTGTNADMIGVSRGGVKTGTVSIPLRNMHTEAEVISFADLEHTCNLLEAYILSGGVAHA